MLPKIYTSAEVRTASSLVKARDMIRNNMFHSRKWLSRGLLAIYARQTEDEQNTESTDLNNSIGFNSHDAQLLSSFAKQFLDQNSLSPKQWSICQSKMLKYSGQLARIARTPKPELATA